MRIRNYIEADLSTMVELLNETCKDEYEFIPYTKEKFLSEIHEGEVTILVAENREVEGFVVLREGVHGEELWMLCVKPGPRQKDIEDSLVSEIEREAKTDRLFVVLDSEGNRIADFMRRGYEIYGGLYQMVARLDGLGPIPPVPRGVILRSLDINEEEALVKVVNAAYGLERLRFGALSRWKSEDPMFTEEWVHVAELHGEIVSVVVSRTDREFNQRYGAKRGYLGPAATHPSHTRKGLAKALTRRAMNFLFQRGMDSVSLYTTEDNVASLALLRSLGFKMGHHWKFLRKTLPKP
ncbi:MAG: putative acetyltransferase [Candidatus Bathyarchaeota archaeon BA1]|nr:MAG: putative acetyltransferase [Candidatus Bathyarchaeota archaeon BA1]